MENVKELYSNYLFSEEYRELMADSPTEEKIGNVIDFIFTSFEREIAREMENMLGSTWLHKEEQGFALGFRYAMLLMNDCIQFTPKRK